MRRAVEAADNCSALADKEAIEMYVFSCGRLFILHNWMFEKLLIWKILYFQENGTLNSYYTLFSRFYIVS